MMNHVFRKTIFLAALLLLASLLVVSAQADVWQSDSTEESVTIQWSDPPESTQYYVQDDYFSDWVNNWLYNSNYNSQKKADGIFDDVRTLIPVADVLSITVLWEQDGQPLGKQVLPAERRSFTITGLTSYSVYDVTVTYKFLPNVDVDNIEYYGKLQDDSLGSTVASTDTPQGKPENYQLVAGESYNASDFGYGSLTLGSEIRGKNTCTIHMNRNLTVGSIEIMNGYTLILTGSGTLTVKGSIYSPRQIDAGGHVISGMRGYLKIKDSVSVNAAALDLLGVDIDTSGEVAIKPVSVVNNNKHTVVFGIDIQGSMSVSNGTVIVDGDDIGGTAVRCWYYGMTGGNMTIRNVDYGMTIISGDCVVMPGSESRGVNLSITAKETAVAFIPDNDARMGDLIIETPEHLTVPAGGSTKVFKDLGGRYIVDAGGSIAAKAVISIDPEEAGPVKSFVRRCYRLILNREADTEGLKGWSGALESKTATAAQTICGFMQSDEFTSRILGSDVVVEILYQTMLNRTADMDGKSSWMKVLDSGNSLLSVIDGFCASPEFIALCEIYGIEPGSVFELAPADPVREKIEAFVKRCYQLILGREADTEGLKGWSDALASGAASAAQIIDGFVRSPEFVNRNLSKVVTVDILYQTMLDRPGDTAGLLGWVDALEQGYTLQHIINGFCGSAEFTAICNDYGISAGTLTVASALVKREAITPEGEEAAPVIVGEYRSEFINEEKIRAFVEHCYVAVFGREGDEEGIRNYTRAILDGKKTPKKVAYEFIFSSEFQSKLPGNEDFIRILYKLYFDREPGAEELAGWVTMLEDGASLEEIVNGFAASDEFKAIVNAMKE